MVLRPEVAYHHSLRFSGKHLQINALVHAAGEIRVELLDPAGKAVARLCPFDPITGMACGSPSRFLESMISGAWKENQSPFAFVCAMRVVAFAFR